MDFLERMFFEKIHSELFVRKNRDLQFNKLIIFAKIIEEGYIKLLGEEPNSELKQVTVDRILDNYSFNPSPLELVQSCFFRYNFWVLLNNQPRKEELLLDFVSQASNYIYDVPNVDLLLIILLSIKEKNIFSKNDKILKIIKSEIKSRSSFHKISSGTEKMGLLGEIRSFIICLFEQSYGNSTNINRELVNLLSSIDKLKSISFVKNKLVWHFIVLLELLIDSKQFEFVLSEKLEEILKNSFEVHLIENCTKYQKNKMSSDYECLLFYEYVRLKDQNSEYFKSNNWLQTEEGRILLPLDDHKFFPNEILSIANLVVGLIVNNFQYPAAVFIRKMIEASMVKGFKILKGTDKDLRDNKKRLKKFETCLDILTEKGLITDYQRTNLSTCKMIGDEVVHNYRIENVGKAEIEDTFKKARFALVNLFREIEERRSK